MANILQQLMQLEMQNRAGRSPSGRGALGTDFANIAKLLASSGATPDGRPPKQITDPDQTINFSPDPIVSPYSPTPTDPSIDYPVAPMPRSPLDDVSDAREAQRRYTQDASGNQTEIGYDGQPISSYSPEQMAIHNAIMGVTPSQSRYVYNGEGYDLVQDGLEANDTAPMPQMPPMGGVTLSNGQFIAGAQNDQGGVNIGTPDFFQKYAGNPDLMRALSDAYGYDVSNPTTRTPPPEVNPVRTDDFSRFQDDLMKSQRDQINVDPRTNMDQRNVDPRQNPYEPPRPRGDYDTFRDDIQY